MLLKRKSKIIVITLLFCIFMLFYFCTVCYSAFSSTMNIDGVGFSRVEADVRITDFNIKDTTNSSISMYENFSKNTISSEVSLKSNSSITYNLEITNYGSVDVGIYSISGLPDGVNYSIEGYNLKDKICDDSGKCNSYAVKTYSLKIYTTDSSYEGIVNLEFEFRVFHNISYVGFTGNYIDSVIDGDSIKVDLGYDDPGNVIVDSSCVVYYDFSNDILNLNNVCCDLEVILIDDVLYDYSYTGSSQEFIAPYDGIYRIQLWGAQGGNIGGVGYDQYNNVVIQNVTYTGGLGAYTAGNIDLNKGDKLYFYVGSTISQTNVTMIGGTSEGGYNGGGFIRSDQTIYGVGGGGATDVRLVSGSADNFDSLKSRIMVAAGGGGANFRNQMFGEGNGGDGGGLVGYNGYVAAGRHGRSDYPSGYDMGTGGTQTVGGNVEGHALSGTITTSTITGGFGKPLANFNTEQTGGGAGYYNGSLSGHSGGGGGSSFISGHDGCNAISESSAESNIIHTGQSIHYSSWKFTDTVMIDGVGYNWTNKKESYVGMPSHDGSSTIKGNTGNGYAKIELIDTCVIYNVTYVEIFGDYPKKIKKGESLTVDFGVNAPLNVSVVVNDLSYSNFTYVDGVLTINNVEGDVAISSAPVVLNYTGDVQEFNVPYNGIYKIELWGSGGHVFDGVHSETVGKGAYVSGNISLNASDKLYVYVGGIDDFNGRGNGEAVGGSATDVRLVGGKWNNFNSLKSRIMVAGGGGSGVHVPAYQGDNPGDAGGLNGYDAYFNANGHGYGYCGHGGTQTSGGSSGIQSSIYVLNDAMNGHFGIGGYAYTTFNNNGVYSYLASGGGSGYYGGGHGVHPGNTWPGGGGGSSFISGHNGCNAITESSTASSIVHTNQANHYSGYVFTNTKMIDGRGYEWTNVKASTVVGMPTFDGNSTMIGNSQTGYAKITFLEMVNN